MHTGQNYDPALSEVFFEDLQIAPPEVFFGAAGDTATQTISAVLAKSDVFLRETRPDAVLVLGDTNSGLSLMAAKRLGIPTFHMEAGNRCFDERVPEELNRRVIDHIADINLPYSKIARENLLREGIPADQIIVTGSPMAEVISFYGQAIEMSPVIERLGLEDRSFFVASLHREENVDFPNVLTEFVRLFNRVSLETGLPIILSTHPRTRKRLAASQAQLSAGIRLVPPLSFTEFVKLQMHAVAVLSDSGTISEEASLLRVPALNLRESHERPEAMEQTSVIMVGNNSERAMQALRVLEHQNKSQFSELLVPQDYSPINISEKVSRIIHSHVDFVSRRNRS